MVFEVGSTVSWKVGDLRAIGIVDLRIENGEVPDVSTKVQGPAYRVKVLRDGEISDDLVALPEWMCDRAALDEPLRERYKIRPPSKSELKKIKQFIPAGGRERDESNTVVVPFLAADNLMNRSLEKWDLASLKTMASIFAGSPTQLNHDWSDVGTIWGKVFDAQYVHQADAPSEALNFAGNGKVNRRIVKEEGFGMTIAKTFANPDSPVVRAISDGFIGHVSTGGFYFSDYICPNCKASFMDDSCPHYPPSRWYGPENEGIADYAIRSGLTDIGELSVVVIPNLPNASVI